MRYLYHFLVMACLTGIACQREISFEQSSISEGAFIRSPSGDCDSLVAGGVFTELEAIDGANFLDVVVVVSLPGSYTIHSDTVNGYFFRNNGSFSNAGTFKLRLSASGKPLKAGTDHFTLSYGASTCVAAIRVKKDKSTPASITLTGAPGLCMDPILFGVLIQGVASDSTNGVSLRVNVREPGKWVIHTSPLNGIEYVGQGTVMDIGEQRLNLYATGTPLQPAGFIHTATIGTSSCDFGVVVLKPVTVADHDYFPLAQGNRWVYDYTSYTTDSLVRVINGTGLFEGDSYYDLREKNPFLPEEKRYFRKSGNSFIEYGSLDRYTTSFSYVPGTIGEIPFLRDAYPSGTYWESPVWSKMAGFGQLIQLQYKYYCIAGDGGAVVNGMAFRNVMKVRMYVIVGSETSPGGSSGEVYEYWYAKGIGLIYEKKMNYQAVVYEQEIRSWMVF